MLRFYKPEPDKLRPTDRMIAHTGFLIFARPVLIDHTEESQSLLVEEGWEADND
jgi:tRNA (adenine57-N1/adenine58-N1)-methyltransferase catalytic subunit